MKTLIARLAIAIVTSSWCLLSIAAPPVPLLDKNHAVDWWFAFKFNSTSFPGCSGAENRTCAFGGHAVQEGKSFSQQFVYASSEQPTLQKRDDCLGSTAKDPLGATFAKIFNGPYFYVVWNDDFEGDPIKGRSSWAHAKGILAWDQSGEGVVLQVTTPSWPGAGSKNHPRAVEANTLGCLEKNNIQFAQHFFALRLSEDDVIQVLLALLNASAITDPTNPQVVRNGGPNTIQMLVNKLGSKSSSEDVFTVRLSTGVGLISKPSNLEVPPWQLVSSLLRGASLRTATWWLTPKIPATKRSTRIGCWSNGLRRPGAVDIAANGSWDGVAFKLTGGSNHAKIAVSTDPGTAFTIFGDENQQGTLDPHPTKGCTVSQNARGGLFFIVEDAQLHESVSNLIAEP